MFKIETLSIYGWTDDPTLLGHGCTDGDNRWPTKAEALAARDELAGVFGFSRSELRVVAADE